MDKRLAGCSGSGKFLSFVFFGVVSFILLPRINKKNNEKPASNIA